MKDYTEWIEAYLDDDLLEAERLEFETEMAQNPALAAEVERIRILYQQLEAVYLRQQVHQALEPAPEFSVYDWLKPLLSISLLVTAMVLMWHWYPPPTTAQQPAAPTTPPAPQESAPAPPTDTVPSMAQRAPAPNKPSNRYATLVRRYQQDPVADNLRSTTPNPTPSDTDKAWEAYQKGQFAASAALIPDTLATQDENARYLRASAHLRAGQYARAAADYQTLSNSFLYRHEARFHLALCQLAQGNEKAARAALQNMASEPNFPFQAAAANLLEAL